MRASPARPHRGRDPLGVPGARPPRVDEDGLAGGRHHQRGRAPLHVHPLHLEAGRRRRGGGAPETRGREDENTGGSKHQWASTVNGTITTGSPYSIRTCSELAH